MSKRISAYLTENESKKWNEYLEQNNLKSTEEIRAFILGLIGLKTLKKDCRFSIGESYLSLSIKSIDEV